jgi:TM2 domain-containing membrane protein YozV
MSDDLMRGEEYPPPPPPPPAPPPLPPPPVYVKPAKNPAAATLLSLFPGLGQIYNGQPAKALVFFLAWVGSIAGAHDQPMPFALMVPFIYLYNMIDAWRSATAINQRAIGGAPLPEDTGIESPAWGGTLVALGLLLLARNLGWLDFNALARYWPVLLIVVGAALLRGSLQRRSNGGHAGV